MISDTPVYEKRRADMYLDYINEFLREDNFACRCASALLLWVDISCSPYTTYSDPRLAGIF